MKGKTKKWALIASLAALFVFAPMAGTSIANNAMPTAAAEEVAEPAVVAVTTNVAKIGDTEYATLSAAMAEANKAAGNYTITLMQDSAQVFTFAQKSGVNITVDGDGNTFTGKITLNAGGGNLTFKDMTVAPANSEFVYLNNNATPNVTIDGCTLQGADQATAVVWGNASGNTSTITIKNSTVDGFAYLVGTNQRASKVILVENVIATNMTYLLRPLKTPDVTVKNVTCAAVIPVQFRAEAENCKLTIEDSTFESIEYAGSYYKPIQTHKGLDSIAYSIIVKGVNQFTKNGVDYEGTSWFSGTAGVTIAVGAQVKTADNTFICGSFADAYEIAESGDTIKLLADYTGDPITLPEGVKLDDNGKAGADKITVVVPDYVAQIGETGYETFAAAIAAANAGDTITFAADINETVTINKGITIDGADFKYTGTMTIEAKDATINFNNINFNEGYVVAAKGKATSSYINVTNCDFVGTGYYALNIGQVANLTVDGCYAYGFKYGFIYVPQAGHDSNVVVKNSTIDKVGSYAVAINSGKAVDLTNVTIKNTYYGICVVDNNAGKTSTLTNTTFENVKEVIAVSGGGKTYNINFVGVNDLGIGTIPTVANIKYTGVQVGTKVYETLGAAVAAATAGNTIKLLGNTTESAVIPHDVGFDYNGFTAENVTTEIARNLTLSGDITLNFYVNKTVVDVTEYTFGWTDGSDIEFIPVVDTKNSIYNIYKIGITPQLMDKEVTLTVGGVSMTSSVVDYCDEALVGADAKLTNLLVDLLNYGAAAQAYMGAEEVMDVSGYVGGTEFVAPANNYVKGTDVEGIDFGDSNVAFRNTNKLVWYFIVTDDTATVTLTKNNVAVEGKSGKFMDIAKKVTYMGVECYMIETDDIMATELDASYVLTVAGANGTVTVEFSVADYVAYHANSNSADANLAKALWCYGQSAKAYNA